MSQSYRIGSGDFQPLREHLKSVGLGADGVLGFGDLGEEASALVHAQFTDVDVLFFSCQWTSLETLNTHLYNTDKGKFLCIG